MVARGFRSRERLLVASVGVACMCAAYFARTWSVPYLVSTALATLVALALGMRLAPRARWMALVGLSGLLTGGAWTVWRNLRATGDSPLLAQASASVALAALDVMPELQRSAERLVNVGASSERIPVTRIEPLLPSPSLGEAAAVIFDRDVLVGWAGVVRFAPDSLRLSAGVARNDFYVVAYAEATRGTRRAVAMRTLSASPPADRLARSWAAVLARRLGVDRVAVSAAPMDSAVTMDTAGVPMLWLRPVPQARDVSRLGAEERGRMVVLTLMALVLLLCTALVWRESPGLIERLTTLAAVGAAVGLAPLSALSNVTTIFNPGYYYSSLGGPWTASVGALAITGALGCLAALALGRARGTRFPHWVGLPLAALCVIGGPFLLRNLARGVALPPRGVPQTLWVAWDVALFLVAACVLLIGSLGVERLRHRRVPQGALLGTVVAVTAALIAPFVWQAPGSFPPWYALLWIVAAGAVVFSGPSRAHALRVAVVGASAATTLVWSEISRKRVDLAERDVAGLAEADDETLTLIDRLLDRVRTEAIPRSTSDLLRLYVRTELAAVGNPIELAVWSSANAMTEPLAELIIAELVRRPQGESPLARSADSLRSVVFREYGSPQGLQLVVAAPLDSGYVFTAVVAPRTRLIAEDPFAALYGLDVPTVVEPPYRLTVQGVSAGQSVQSPRWTRREDEVRGDWKLAAVLGSLHAHVVVELRSFDVLLVRGALLVILDLTVFAVLWLLLLLSDRALLRWMRGRASRYWRSYRARLTVALFGAFALPSTAFAIWTLNRLSDESAVSRALLVQETLRAVRGRSDLDLRAEAERLNTPLLLYRGGALVGASDPLYTQLAPLGHLLDPVAVEEILLGEATSASRRLAVGSVPTLVGYRVLNDGSVLAAPARRSELTLERQQGDVLALLWGAMALGTLIALWLSGLAARVLASPVAALRRAAGDVASGARELESLGEAPLSEFTQVYGTFRRMAVDLSDSRLALESARRRTEAVLRDVASGVIALSPGARVLLANPAAERMLSHALAPNDALIRPGDAALEERALAFLKGDIDEDAFDLQLRGRQLRAHLTRLSRGDGGAVLTLDDVTDMARAQRVFAWGEMARQVAHEIKNPLTPIRLGIQHLRRAHADGRGDFREILDRNADRILQEIDRLDEIARAFARFGLRPGDAQSAASVDVSTVARDVVELERLGESGISWEADLPDVLIAQARDGELREVLLNLLENARHAHASHVVVRGGHQDGWIQLSIEDDGDGIPVDLLPRVFEPQFSTRTSGSGLGLAISKRLVESWGGRIRLERRDPRGTTVTIALVATPAA